MKFYAQSFDDINKRNYQEDYNIIKESNDETELFIGIYDGHGGSYISNYLNNNLVHYIFNQQTLTKIKIMNVYKKINKIFENNYYDEAMYSGSTAIFVLLKNIKQKIYCTIANLGDCRCIIVNSKMKKTFSTIDHKPNNINEKKRIEKLGGKVYFDGFSWRIGNLNLTRAFGDFDAKPYISNIPDVNILKLKKDDKFIIIASDGFWDTVSIKECINILKQYINSLNKKFIELEEIEYLNTILCKTAIANKSHDNITIATVIIQ